MNDATRCDGVTRRDLLRVGGLTALGWGLGDFFRLQHLFAAETSPVAKAKSCILIYKYGSPPQHETYDPKPDAPSAIQGEMRAIPTNVPGVAVGEGLPKIASLADRLTFVRSLTHPFPLHGTV